MKDKYKFKEKISPHVKGISKKTIHKIIQAWYETDNAPSSIKPDIPPKDRRKLIIQIQACIDNIGGEISHQAKLIHLAMIYLNASEKGKKVFLQTLAVEFDVNLVFLREELDKLSELTEDSEEKAKMEIEFSKALVPPRVKFIRQLSTIPNGFIFLKDMREFLLKQVKEFPCLKKLDNDILSILKQYFDVNLLKLKEINWSSPAATLEHLIQYEAVHEIKSWKHLKIRLFTNHLMYGFFHPTMPEDPLIFVEVALVKGLANNIQKLIDLDVKHEKIENANTAIFYSISSTQKGLRGISFGNFLIKRVVKKLSADLPHIKNYATLSPMPLFGKWLVDYLENEGEHFCKKTEVERIVEFSGDEDINKSILTMLHTKDWHLNEKITEILKTPMLRLTLHYLSKVKRKGRLNAYDPVANFHLSNGAEIGQLNWLGDTSKKGLKQSFGIMLNYRYKLNNIINNHETYLTNGEIHISKNILKDSIFDDILSIIYRK